HLRACDQHAHDRSTAMSCLGRDRMTRESGIGLESFALMGGVGCRSLTSRRSAAGGRSVEISGRKDIIRALNRTLRRRCGSSSHGREARGGGRGDEGMKLLIAIPALNEEGSVGTIIERSLAAREWIIRESPVTDVQITVVSDGSTDRTAVRARPFTPA